MGWEMRAVGNEPMLTEAQLHLVSAGVGSVGGGMDRSIISSQGSKPGMGSEQGDQR